MMWKHTRLLASLVFIFGMVMLVSTFHPVPIQTAQAKSSGGLAVHPEINAPFDMGEGSVAAPGIQLRQAMAEGRYPAQVASSLGSMIPNRYGPDRNDPAEGIPVHAYSPFAEENNREHPCPSGGCEYMPGQVLLKLAPDAEVYPEAREGRWSEDAGLDQALWAVGAESIQAVFPWAVPPRAGETVAEPDGVSYSMPDLTRWYLVELSGREGADVYVAAETLMLKEEVAYAEPNFLRSMAEKGEAVFTTALAENARTIPDGSNDPLFGQQWHLASANIPAAWQWLADHGYPPGGSSDVVVAVIDSGIDALHPDLAANLWVNQAEYSGSSGVDDDVNGYVDDIYGADTVTPDGNPQDDHGHGTHVAGIIAAQANNGIGGVGVAYNVKIMPVKAAQYSGVLAASDIAEAIYYAVEKGADVINMSFGGYSRSQVEEDALVVAFGQAVLVAAAGNDAKVNLPCNQGRDMYPAAYNWVIAVMARSQFPNSKGDNLAGFSNFDCSPRDTHEYELMAPGSAIWSTLPGGEYAAWSGTSMAAPVVSGMAALARTRWADKNVYSSRFIMGQIATTGPLLQGYTPPGKDPVDYSIPDALAALTTSPKPEVAYLEHWLFDTAEIDAFNDDDGIVDAGETGDLAITLRNHWGTASPVTVTLEAWQKGTGSPDPYVTMITGTVAYGAIGSFNTKDNGLIYDPEGAITGVAFPFRFTTDPNTPNDHLIPFRLTITAGNGIDPGDPGAPYTFESYFYLLVQRGVELPFIITEDMVLTKDYYWLVSDSTLVSEGVTVTITEGTQLQFFSADPSDPYSRFPKRRVYIQVEGVLNVEGTAAEPVEMFPGKFYSTYPIIIFQKTSGSTFIQYARIANPVLGSVEEFEDTITLGQPLNTLDHVFVTQPGDCIRYYFWGGWGYCEQTPIVRATVINKVIMEKLGYGYFGNFKLNHENCHLQASLLDSLHMEFKCAAENTVFLKNYKPLYDNAYDLSGAAIGAINDADPNFFHNAILNVWWNPGLPMGIVMDLERGNIRHIENNFWGTTSTTLIEEAIYDFYDDFNRGEYQYQPVLTESLTTMYPFVVDVVLSTAVEPDVQAAGAEIVTFTVSFNRDMDMDVQPLVSFGPDIPYTDFLINGDWVNARTWRGAYKVTPVTGDGYQLIRATGAVAADDPWLVTGDDSARFRFLVETSGTAAMSLQASGGEGYVDLMWTQTDFDLLAGFHLYRSATQDGEYSRVNSNLLPPDQRDYLDTGVEPGQPYYYKFTVVKTDMTESDYSNTATATPLDTLLPVIVHNPVTTAPPGLPLTLNADVTDNVGVQSVTLYYRLVGSPGYSSRAMLKTTGDRYSATLEGSLMVSPGIEYYMQANDGINTVRSGRPDFPHLILVQDRPVVTIVTPNKGPSSGGTNVTISGSNFKTGATVTLGGAACFGVEVVSSVQVTCTTPPHFPETVDVTVTNPDQQSGTLLLGFTFEASTASLGLPNDGGGQHAIVQVPVNLVNVNGLVAASFTVGFDPAVLTALGAKTGNLALGWGMTANTNTSGEIRVSMASGSGPVNGSGVLVQLEFDVLGAAGADTVLHLSNVLLNDGAIPVELADGSFSVDLVYSMSGQVSYWNGGVISGTLLTLSGDHLHTGMSQVTGLYTITYIQTDDYLLVPSKSGDVNGISAYDASLALQHDAGLIVLQGHPFTGADVNRNGVVTAMDAYYILQKAAGLIEVPFTGAGAAWLFSPASYGYTGLAENLADQDFTAILLGDPTGNWQPPMRREPRQPDVLPATVSLPQTELDPGEQATIPLLLYMTEGSLYGLDLVLSYDPSVITITAVGKGPLATDWILLANLNTPGTVQVALAGAVSITTGGELLSFTLQAVGEAGDQSSLEFTQADLNEGLIPTQKQNGLVHLSGFSVYLPLVVR